MDLRSTTINSILIGLGVLVAVGILELVLRVSGPINQSNNEQLYHLVRSSNVYEPLPNVNSYSGRISTNPLGIRSSEMQLPSRHRGVRILVLGDSITFAGNDPYSVTFTAKLENLLRSFGGSSTVLNAGVPGYSPHNQLAWYEAVGKNLHPDVVVIQVCLNDIVDPLLHWQAVFGESLDESVIPHDAVPDITRRPGLRFRKLMRRSAVFTAMEDVILHSIPPSKYLSLEDSLSIDTYANEDSPSMKWLDSKLSTLVDRVREQTNRIILLVPPLSYQLEAGYSNWSPQEFFKKFADRKKIQMLDLRNAFSDLGMDRAYRLFRYRDYYDIWHFSPEGHDVAAKALADEIWPKETRGRPWISYLVHLIAPPQR